MIKISKLILIIFAFTISSFATRAQELWSLQKCIEYALENNISIKQQYLNTQYNENIYEISKASVLPNLNAGADYNLNFGRIVDPYTNDFADNNVKSSNMYISSSVTLFKGFQNTNTIRKNKLNLQASVKDLEKLNNDISLNISTAYLQILFNKEMKQIAENQLEQAKIQEERTRILVNSGKLAQGNLLEMQAQTASDELQYINAQNQLEESYIILKQILDIKDTVEFAIEEPEISDMPIINNYTFDQVYEAAQKLPQISAANYRLMSSETELSIARGGRYPVLSLNATYATGFSDARKLFTPGDSMEIPIGYLHSTYEPVYSIQPTFNENNYTYTDQLSDNASTSVGFRLSIPIFNGFQVNNNIQNTKINVLNQKYMLETEKNNLYKEIKKAFFDLESAQAKYNSSKKAAEANEKAFEYIEKKYNLGLINSTEYNLSKNNLLMAKSTFVQAKYEYLFKKSILDFYAGKPIKLVE